MFCPVSHKTSTMKVEIESEDPKSQSGTLNTSHSSSLLPRERKDKLRETDLPSFSCTLGHSHMSIYSYCLGGLKLFAYLPFSNLVSLGDWHTRERDV